MVTVAEQSKKEGRSKTTSHGVWKANYELFSSDDLVDSELLQVWFNFIKNVNLPATSGYGSIILQIHGGTGDVDNYMTISRKDYS